MRNYIVLLLARMFWVLRSAGLAVAVLVVAGAGCDEGSASQELRCGTGVRCEAGSFCGGVGPATGNSCACAAGFSSSCTAAAPWALCVPDPPGGPDAPYDCDPVPARISNPAQVCGCGELHSIVGGTWGPCVSFSQCRPIPCDYAVGGQCPLGTVCGKEGNVCVAGGS